MGKEEINAFLGASTEYNGRLVFQGAVRMDGIFNGEVSSEGSLIVGKDATVDGTLEVGELMLSGSFTGKAYAKKKVTIYRGGKFIGEIHAPVLVVEEGAILEGSINMINKPSENIAENESND